MFDLNTRGRSVLGGRMTGGLFIAEEGVLFTHWAETKINHSFNTLRLTVRDEYCCDRTRCFREDHHLFLTACTGYILEINYSCVLLVLVTLRITALQNYSAGHKTLVTAWFDFFFFHIYTFFQAVMQKKQCFTHLLFLTTPKFAFKVCISAFVTCLSLRMQ